MLVMTLERVSSSMRGDLTRWLIEVHEGVYVGKVSAIVRDLLWEKAVKSKKDGRCTQAWSANSELGFEFRISGDGARFPVDFDGLPLIAERTAAWERMKAKGSFRDRGE